MRRKFKIGDILYNEEVGGEPKEVIAFSRLWDSYVLANPNGDWKADIVIRDTAEEYFRLKKE